MIDYMNLTFEVPYSEKKMWMWTEHFDETRENYMGSVLVSLPNI